MRRRRIKVEDQSAVYHCVTRTVNKERLFAEADRETLRRQLWQAADFSGVEVLTYCLLENHFHVLVRVPERTVVADAELVRRYRVLYPRKTRFTGQHGGGVLAAHPDLGVEEILQAGGPDAERLRVSLQARMGDVSEFMKTLKQRFSVWFNHAHDRCGTLWSERFKSVLVEATAEALATMAAYIDLNPVRAGLVEDPKDYRFCGYAEALGHQNPAIRRGLERVLECDDWEYVLREYRMILFGKGSFDKADGSAAETIPPEQAAAVLNAGGKLPIATVLRCRVRYFTDGAVLGTHAYVQAALERYQRDTGQRRQSEPHPMTGADWSHLAVLRGLRTAVFG